MQNACKRISVNFGKKFAGIRPHKTRNIRWDYNIKMDFKEISCQRAE
jgi:hypothetical protein